MPQLTIAQLSDIHFTGKQETDPILSKLPSLAARLCETTWNSDLLVLALVGDLADKGLADQFTGFTSALNGVLQTVRDRNPNLRIEVLAVPGNHDSDHSAPSTVRDNLLSTLDLTRLDEQLFCAISSVQQSFFKFDSIVTTSAFTAGTWKDRLSRKRYLKCDACTISFNLINTAWTCKKRDLYGTPRLFLQPSDGEQADLAIAIMHHPPTWMNQDDFNSTGRSIYADHDLILTGHIHVDRGRRVIDDSGLEYRHIQSGYLQDTDDPIASSFRVVQFDCATRELITSKFTWDGNTYQREPEQNPLTVQATVSRRAGFLPSFVESIDDLGMMFKHPSPMVKKLALPAVFVPPRLAREDASASTGSVVRGEALVDELLNQSKTLIIGAESSGKTALSRMLTRLTADRGLYPILISDGILSLSQHQDVVAEVHKVIASQYLPASVPTVIDAPAAQRVIIIDDIHKVATKEKARLGLIAFVGTFADHVIILAPENFVVDELTNQGRLASALAGYTRYRFLEMSYKLRYQLIENWFLLGADNETEEDAERVRRDIEFASTTITGALERDYMPSYPLFVLGLLQNIGSMDPTKNVTSSYGHLFEAMIYQRLAVVPRDACSDLELRVNYLANLAFKLFSSQNDQLGGAELTAWHQEFCEIYARRIARDAMIRDLEATTVIKRRSDGIVFSYPYLLCFFLAKYLATEIHTEIAKGVVRNLVESMWRDDYSQTLLSLCHLSKDPSIVDAVRIKVNSILAGFTPFDVANGTASIDRLLGQMSKLVVAETPDERRRVRDVLLDRDDQKPTATQQALLVDDRGVKLVQDLNGSYRAVQIVGQILKSFSGSMRGNEKEALADAAIKVVLKALAVLVEMAQSEVDVFVGKYEAVLAESEEPVGNEEMTKKVTRRLSGMLRSYGVGIVKHVSASMGSTVLAPVFDRLRANDPENASLDLIIFGIELDHYREFPISSLDRILTMCDKGVYGKHVVQYLVWMHLVIFNVKFDVRQRACSRAGIELESRLAFNPTLKRMESRQIREK